MNKDQCSSMVFPSTLQMVTKLKTILLSNVTPFADLMLHPEKIEAVLNSAPAQIPSPATPPKKREKRGFDAPAERSGHSRRPSDKKTKFFLKACGARSVKVAGDFTEWGKSPIDMILTGDGDWSAVVSLEPGQYAYRFIVDGQWHDDPGCVRRIPNAFGSENAVIEVI
jgi:hypothetical protein